MLSLVGVLNGAAIAATHFLFFYKNVKHRGVSKLKHMADKTGYRLALDMFNFILG